jgi:hypothetical protein
MSKYPDIYHREKFDRLPDHVRPAVMDDFNKPKKEMEGLGYYVRAEWADYFTRYTINRFTGNLAGWFKNGQIWVDDPPRKYYTENISHWEAYSELLSLVGWRHANYST